jgi:hypothetical protein
MKLARVQLSCPELHLDLALSFEEEASVVRSSTLIYGGPGVGKTLLLGAIAHTRPGHCVAFSQVPGEPRITTQCVWLPGMDEPDHRGRIELVTPTLHEELRHSTPEKRREAAFFDRLAREGGFVFLAFSALRWFSHAPLLLSAPERTLARHDVRAYEPLGDATRHDLTRATLAMLVYAEVTGALHNPTLWSEETQYLATALRRALSATLAPLGVTYLGLHPRTLDPTFVVGYQQLTFNQLSTQAKNTVAIVTATVRALWAAYPGLNPLIAQGVVAIDQLELHYEAHQANAVLAALEHCFPQVQWVITTRSAELLALRDAGDVLVLRRSAEGGAVQVFAGEGARIH